MLGRSDRQKLAELERELTIDDPDFVARMRAGSGPLAASLRRPVLLRLMSFVLGAAALVFATFAAWLPFFNALILVAALEIGWLVWRAGRDGEGVEP
ncbi:DUF3040 domain-containing protein [Krasilnikovia sp. MM14-A1259]|uniref:DUF3040 domain-containing protein n=1 Tax=Krasilnikovia sp. MM14-A1259 TaxID=3373539 RepID=UPI0037F2806C